MAMLVDGEATLGAPRVGLGEGGTLGAKPARRAWLSAATVTLCTALGACTIQTGGSADESGGASAHDQSPAATDACDEVDRLPERDKRTAAEAGEAALARDGKSLADAWSDPAAFQLFREAAYDSAGCDLVEHATADAGKLQQGLHADGGPDYYCGPGHGSDKLLVPAVSGCLNELCRTHDACYAQCSSPTGGACVWGGPTAACDDPFMEAMNGCQDDSNEFGSFLVRFLANGLYALGLGQVGCPADMTCPGNGPCLADRQSEACNYCLEKLDIGGVCLERACSEDPDETTCYAANCPTVSGCYGGYDVPVPPATKPPTPDVDPASVWSLSVVQAVIPNTKPAGETWDADAGGFASPDVVIGVRTGQADAAQASTAVVQDNLVPMWSQELPLVEATALDLQTFIEFSATDLDLAFDDPIGSCTTAAVPSDFSGDPVPFECSDGEGVLFTVYFALTPAG